MAYWRIRASVAALGRPYGPKSGPGLTACFDTLNSRQPPVALLAQDGHRLLRHRLVREEVELEALAQDVVGHLADPALPRRPGIRHDDVDAAELLGDARERGPHALAVGHVAGKPNAADLLGRGLGRRLVEVEHGDRRAFRRERLGGGPADAAAGAGHHRHLAGEGLGHRALQLGLLQAPVFDVEQVGLGQRLEAADRLGVGDDRDGCSRRGRRRWPHPWRVAPMPNRPTPGTSTTRGIGSSLVLTPPTRAFSRANMAS